MRSLAATWLLLLIGLVALCPAAHAQDEAASGPIQPYAENPRYWQYGGEPALLLGGSKDDNLFQIPDLEAHLDAMAAVGGNYIRNTMSARDEGNVRPFHRRADGRYDLDRWNDAYWDRFEQMLALTHARGIIVQIELWDQHDHNEDKWNRSPWNPDQNVNYDAAAVSLKGRDHYANVQHNTDVQHDLFLTVPALQNDETVLAYQKQFVDKVLEHATQYDHVLYTVTNELFIQHPPAWSRFWVDYLHDQDEGLQVTEMFQLPDVQVEQHRVSLDDPDTFDYVDISQNARQQGQAHWDKLQWVRSYLSDHPRPINHVKTYGGDVEWTYGPDHAIDAFWRSIIGGAASMRFHRPPAGIGLNERAKAHLRSARMLTEAFDVVRATPDVESERLSARDPDEAYLAYVAGEAYAVYFPDGGAVTLDLEETTGSFRVRWLNIAERRWQEATTVEGGGPVALDAPGDGDWGVLLQAAE
jgi:hypothetical protein